jgi:hypothetical protein
MQPTIEDMQAWHSVQRGKIRGMGPPKIARSENRAATEEKFDSAVLSLHVFSIRRDLSRPFS